MSRFSLIVATVNRYDELSLFLASLLEQGMYDFELIVVDQNPDDRLDPLLQQWLRDARQRWPSIGNAPHLVHLRALPGLSKARNSGSECANGDIIAFPDDDCWYEPTTLAFVEQWFARNPDYGILCLGSRDRSGAISGNRWPQEQCDLTRTNVFRTTATYSYFLHRGRISRDLLFDPEIGPGASTIYGAGEDTELILSLMDTGVRGRFLKTPSIGHPCKPYDSDKRAWSYGAGFGRVMAKHRMRTQFLGLVLFDLIRIPVHFLKGNRNRGSRLWSHAAGMTRTYFLSR
jgi:glycosyltransferase involved in cell wall biosynthesis